MRLLVPTRVLVGVERGTAFGLAVAHAAVARHSTLGVGVASGTAASVIISVWVFVLLTIAMRPTMRAHKVGAPLGMLVAGGRGIEFVFLAIEDSTLWGTVAVQLMFTYLIVGFHFLGSLVHR